MINNEIGRDERVHLSENDVIENQKQDTEDAEQHLDPAAAGDDEAADWPAKSENLLQDASEQGKRKTICKKIQGAIFPVIVLGIILALVIMLFIINNTPVEHPGINIIPYTCDHKCSISLVESIPENLTYNSGAPSHPTTYSAYKTLISEANQSLYISSMYWTLRMKDTPDTSEVFPSSQDGDDIYSELKKAIEKRNVDVRIAVSTFEGHDKKPEIDDLKRSGADVRVVDMERLLGSGILHTKFIISDMKSFYLGSANMDWRSLTQVKEMGVLTHDCNCPLVSDLHTIFDMYWQLGTDNSTIPSHWPEDMDTFYNMSHPLELEIADNETARVSLSSSPQQLATPSRDVDLQAIKSVMDDASRYINVAVMDYFPTTLYMKDNEYWPDLDDNLRRAAFERNVDVKLLASIGANTNLKMLTYLRSLDQLDGITVKAFVVPSVGNQTRIPYARVNHNKYMVTDHIAYIGTSNWSGDYFISTAGVGMIFNQTASRDVEGTIRDQLHKVFNRDWNSGYSHNISSRFEVRDGQVIVTPP